MREEVRDKDRLEHILEAIDRILDFTNGKTRKEITSDSMRFFGIVKNTKNLPSTKTLSKLHKE